MAKTEKFDFENLSPVVNALGERAREWCDNQEGSESEPAPATSRPTIKDLLLGDGIRFEALVPERGKLKCRRPADLS